MRARFIGGMLAALFLAFATVAAAHPGHDYKIMGTVSSVHENHLEIAGTDKKTHTVTLNDKTKLLRGTTKVEAADIEVGERIVLTARQVKGDDGKLTLVAREVKLSSK